MTTSQLGTNRYGKSQVRVARTEQDAGADGAQRIVDRTVQVMLQGGFEAAHVAGDNALVLATDTMKNTVHALMHDGPDGEALEGFLLRLHDHLCATGDQVESVAIEASEARWRRINVDGAPHEHAFEQQRDQRTARIEGGASDRSVHGGVEELSVLKTTNSWFRGFPRTPLTTLAETDDRVLATIITASWRYGGEQASFDATSTAARDALLATFATHPSPSVQATLYAMGTAALEACSEIDEITLTLPNRHYLPLDLTALGRTDRAMLLPTSEPFGVIEATVCRS